MLLDSDEEEGTDAMEMRMLKTEKEKILEMKKASAKKWNHSYVTNVDKALFEDVVKRFENLGHLVE